MSHIPTEKSTLPPLPPKLKQVYDLRHEGKSLNQIADIMDHNRETIVEYVSRIRKRGYDMTPVQTLFQERYALLVQLLNEGYTKAEVMQKMNLQRRQFGAYMTRFRKENGAPPLWSPNPNDFVQKVADLHLKEGKSFQYISDLLNVTKGRVAGIVHRYKKAQENDSTKANRRRPRPSR